MDKPMASALLGLSEDLTPAVIEAAFNAKRETAEQRLSRAPTDSLRAKYAEALAQLDQARVVLLTAQTAAAGGLSRTQMADLPGAAPLYTRMGSGPTPAGTATLLQAGEVLAQRYEIRECIGTGGMGAVYRAFDRNRGEEIAIKVLLPHLLAHPQARDRLVAEAKIASSLSHPNIVNVFDLQRDGNVDFLTMELLQGQTLRSLMQARKAARQPFMPAEALEIAKAIGGALDYAHKRTVHRDLKPENVWVEEDGTYKLMDFGIARVMTNSQMTQTTTAMGTAYYMAPEQLRGAKEIDGRADQYALAVLMYELLSGEIPAGRMHSLKEVNKTVPAAMSKAVDRALEPQPEARFAHLGEFALAMQRRNSMVDAARARWFAPAFGSILLAVTGFATWPQIAKWVSDQTRTPERAKDLRKSSEAARFFDRGDGTLQDNHLHVTWTKRDNGSNINWNDGRAWCVERGAGWDLPSVDELQSLVDVNLALETPCGPTNCRISPQFHLSSSHFWSSERDGSSNARAAYLAAGGAGSHAINENRFVYFSPRVLCIRHP